MKDNKTAEALNERAARALGQGRYLEALKDFEAAAALGDYLAMYNIACMYYFGDGVPKNDSKAFEWYIKASEHGDPEAANRAGLMLASGIGVVQDPKRGFGFFLRSAEGGSLSGMANLAKAYLEGLGCAPSIKEGLHWMNCASEQGNGIASLLLGNYYRDAVYVEQDYQMARTFYERGKAQKYRQAIEALAELYRLGLGVDVDESEAEKLENLAAQTPDED